MMKIRKKLLFLPILIWGCLLYSCSDDVTLSNKVDEGEYKDVAEQYLALRNYETPKLMQNVEVRNVEATVNVYLQIAKALTSDLSGTIAIDESALVAYNAKNGTSFSSFPASLVTINNNSVTIPSGKTDSAPLSITIKGDSTLLTVGSSYILPLSFTKTSGDINAVTTDDSYLYVVKYMGDIPDVSKASGIKTIMFFEVNDSNILNAGEYTMKNTGKSFADVVTIFAANINYNTTTGKVYLSLNENVSHILNNRDKYIKPLQDKGIKVTLCILGNGDAAGVANLSDAVAKDYAQQLKNAVDYYGLDGIDFDDEYSKYSQSTGIPGFAPVSREHYARLCYETKMAMPDKLVSIYHYNDAHQTNGFSGFQIDGLNAGEYLDHAFEPNYNSFVTSIQGAYDGMTKQQVAPYSRKIYYKNDKTGVETGLVFTDSQLKRIRTEGYGVNMLYNYNIAMTANYEIQFDRMAQILYDEGIVWSGNAIAKDY